MMTQRKPRLHKQVQCNMDKELRISMKSLLSLFFLVVAFFIFAFIVKGPTYGVL